MASIDYTLLADVKAFLNITDASADATLGAMITQVSRAIDTYVFGPNVIGFATTGETIDEITEFHDGGFESIILRRLLSDDATERAAIVLEEDGVALTQDADFQVDDFPARTLYRTSALDKFGICFTEGRRNVKVTYNPAYQNVPEDIERVATEETARAYLASNNASTDGGSLMVTQRTPDTGTVISYRADDFSLMSLRVLDGYRKRLSFV